MTNFLQNKAEHQQCVSSLWNVYYRSDMGFGWDLFYSIRGTLGNVMKWPSLVWVVRWDNVREGIGGGPWLNEVVLMNFFSYIFLVILVVSCFLLAQYTRDYYIHRFLSQVQWLMFVSVIFWSCSNVHVSRCEFFLLIF